LTPPRRSGSFAASLFTAPDNFLANARVSAAPSLPVNRRLGAATRACVGGGMNYEVRRYLHAQDRHGIRIAAFLMKEDADLFVEHCCITRASNDSEYVVGQIKRNIRTKA
jgi:hypothetical protein